MLALWLAGSGQQLLIWGALGAVSVAGATLLLNLLRLVANYARQWQQMRDLPALPGAYPLLGHTLLLPARRPSQRPGAALFEVPAALETGDSVTCRRVDPQVYAVCR